MTRRHDIRIRSLRHTALMICCWIVAPALAWAAVFVIGAGVLGVMK